MNIIRTTLVVYPAVVADEPRRHHCNACASRPRCCTPGGLRGTPLTPWMGRREVTATLPCCRRAGGGGECFRVSVLAAATAVTEGPGDADALCSRRLFVGEVESTTCACCLFLKIRVSEKAR